MSVFAQILTKLKRDFRATVIIQKGGGGGGIAGTTNYVAETGGAVFPLNVNNFLCAQAAAPKECELVPLSVIFRAGE